jgi:deoxyadenosine/deoxycytidine kinase
MASLVSITGPIAAGATTLAGALAAKMAWLPAFEEDVEAVNPFFSKYHIQPRRYAFHNQVAFLARSVERHIQLKQSSGGNAITVQDYTPFEHTEVYAHVQYKFGRLKREEYEFLLYLAQVFESLYIIPRVLIYRPIDEDAVLHRVRDRGRPSEQLSDIGFLSAIRQRFDEWAGAWTRSPVIRLDDNLDVFVDHDAVDRLGQTILRMIP